MKPKKGVMTMEENMTDLNLLAKRYQEQIQSLQGQLDEAKRKFTVISEAKELLKREGVFDQENLKTPVVISDRYSDKSVPEAIEDVLRTNQPNKLPATTIHLELLKYGVKSESKNFKGDVHSVLNRMEESGKILSAKRGKGKKKYFLPKKEEEKKDLVST
jgi:hypothetical protein